jgi:hypothetical protein
VFFVGATGHAAKKGDSIANVKAADNEGIHELSQYLAVGETDLRF